jgi:redox-sensitive bicupin YhaK (pirin superfamily)
MSGRLEMTISPRERDLGGFSVRRLLPFATHRMVGPFIFFDHMGPAEFSAGMAMDVRPHPHVNLATVTYLFEGKIEHRDSLGSDQLIEPGAINWMTAGHGIVHSERTPEDLRDSPRKMNGIQLWVALPEEFEEIPPTFSHHPKETLPEFKVDGVEIKLLLGKLFGKKSPVRIHSDLFYAQALLKKGQTLSFKTEGREAAMYCSKGLIKIDGQEIPQFTMAVGAGADADDFEILALEDSCVMLIGGHPIGPRFIEWNFVSSSKERLEQVKAEWKNGPGPNAKTSRFKPIPGDNKEFIPLP